MNPAEKLRAAAVAYTNAPDTRTREDLYAAARAFTETERAELDAALRAKLNQVRDRG